MFNQIVLKRPIHLELHDRQSKGGVSVPQVSWVGVGEGCAQDVVTLGAEWTTREAARKGTLTLTWLSSEPQFTNRETLNSGEGLA